MQSTALRAGIYSRESKDKTKSIDDQTADSCDAAHEHGWTIARKYCDGTSASRFGRKDRSGWQQLLDDLDATPKLLDVVVAWEPSRADRDLETWIPFVSACRRRGVLVHLTSDDDTLDPRNPAHWHRLVTGGVDAAMESEKISRRTRRGTARSAAAGKAHGPAPFGYTRVIVGEERTASGPKPVKEQRKSADASTVVDIITRIARDEPISAIVRDLNARAIPAPQGARWTRDAVRSIAKNPAYAGQRRHRTHHEGDDTVETLHDAVWPALVDVSLFTSAQRVLGQPNRHKAKPGRLKWMLSYLAIAPCGAPLHVAPGKGGRVARYECGADSCVGCAVWAADEIVTRIICGRLSRPDARDLFLPANDTAGQEAVKEAADLRRQLDQHYDDAAAKRLSAGGLVAMERRLLPLIDAAEKRSRAVPKPQGTGALVELLDAADSGGGEVRRVWDSLPVAGRRGVVELLAGVVIGKASRRMSRWASEDERLEVAGGQLGGSRWVGDTLTWADHWAAVSGG